MTEAVAAPAAAAPAAPVEAVAATPAAPATPAANPLELAPAAPAAPEPSAPAAPASKPVSYEKTGDTGLDMALDFVGQRGFGPDHPAMVAAETGDFAPLKAALAALGDKAQGWEGFLALAERSHGDRAASVKAKQAKDLAAIHEAVGGDKAWDNIRAWAAENAEPEERTAVNAALSAGGIAAKAMALYLGHLHANASGVVKEPASVTAPGAAGKPAGEAPVTAREFAKQSQALRQRLGHDFENSTDFRALVARREVARRSGH